MSLITAFKGPGKKELNRILSSDDLEWKIDKILPKAIELLKHNKIKVAQGTEYLLTLASDKDTKVLNAVIGKLPQISETNPKLIKNITANLAESCKKDSVDKAVQAIPLIALINKNNASVAVRNFCAKGELSLIHAMVNHLENTDTRIDISASLKTIKKRPYKTEEKPQRDSALQEIEDYIAKTNINSSLDI